MKAQSHNASGVPGAGMAGVGAGAGYGAGPGMANTGGNPGVTGT